MHRAAKETVTTALHEALAGAQVVILTQFRGLTVAQMTDLRRELRQSGARFQVIKNTLARRAGAGTSVAPLFAALRGPAAIAVSPGDPVAPAKVLTQFARTQPKLEIRAGVVGGRVISLEEIRALATLPSREVLLGRLVGAFAAPLVGLVGVLSAPARALLLVLRAVADAKQGSPAS